MTLDEAREHIGQQVTYHPRRAAARAQVGVITSVGQTYVFVRYADQPYEAPGQATAPQFLTLAHQEATS